MRRSAAVSVVLAGLLCTAAWVGGSSVGAGESTSPPTQLKKVGDHWTPWDPPPAGPGAYIIQKGDTLWDLAATWLDDPFLWPQVWDENRYILDSHWIYPGDPLVIPGRPTVIPADGPPPGSESADSRTGQLDATAPGTATMDAAPRLHPVADATDVYCSGYIDPDHRPAPLTISGHELEGEIQATGDVVYLDQGTNQGLRAGDLFTIRRPTRSVAHPSRVDETLGTMVRRLGRVRVMLARENDSTAVIEFACEDIVDGDELVPWREIPVPQLSAIPGFDRYDVSPSGGAVGEIATSTHDLIAFGEGEVVFTTLGLTSGVRPGDVLTVYRDRLDQPRAILGQAVVLTVEPLSSLAKVTRSVREFYVGDAVEVIR